MTEGCGHVCAGFLALMLTTQGRASLPASLFHWEGWGCGVPPAHLPALSPSHERIPLARLRDARCSIVNRMILLRSGHFCDTSSFVCLCVTKNRSTLAAGRSGARVATFVTYCIIDEAEV